MSSSTAVTENQPVIDTVGETVEVDSKDIPIYTVSRAIEWMKRPENKQKIEQMSRTMGESTRNVARQVDREVGKVGALLRDIAIDDDVAEDFTNSLLKSIFNLGDD